jgi:ferredoxin-nitrite reductase
LHQQVQSGLNYLGLSIPLGRFYADEIEELATIAETYGDGSIRTTNSQDLILPNIPDAKTEAVLSEKVLTRLTPFPKPFTAHAISCTGTQFCPLGVAETKQRAAKILEYLDQHVELDTPIVVHFSGCVNSCGQNQIADIGLQGTVVKVGDQIVEAFTFSIGGRLGPQASFGIKLKGSVPADRVAKAIESLVNAFKAHRAPGESFSDVVKRIGTDAFQLALDKFI